MVSAPTIVMAPVRSIVMSGLNVLLDIFINIDLFKTSAMAILTLFLMRYFIEKVQEFVLTAHKKWDILFI